MKISLPESRGSCSFSLPDAERGFPRRCRVDSERMHAAGKLGGERRVDHAMALQPALPAKRFRHDIESEMGLAAGPVPGMAFVAMGFILDLEALRRESITQLFCDLIACVHVAL